MSAGRKGNETYTIGLFLIVLAAPSASKRNISPTLASFGREDGRTDWRNRLVYHRGLLLLRHKQGRERRLRNNTNPALIIYNLNNQRMQELRAKNQWDEIARILADAAKRLHSGGAQHHPGLSRHRILYRLVELLV